ncbi:MAG: molybdopterin-dependent oxidoreductase [Gemmatimonadaceae bacterium]|nr:molybdopterin-dependent oxidoreductase [Gemmatimonadaceae bacterium]
MRRRTFLLAGLGAGSALFLGWSLVPPRQRLRGSATPALPAGAIALNGWLAIAPDDTVTIIAPKAEMGQGVHTALAMLIAEELGCDWAKVSVRYSPVDAIYNNVAAIVDGLPFHPDLDDNAGVRALRWLTAKTIREAGVMMTGGSSSVRDCWEIARVAGATARTALVQVAAQRWNVAPAACTVANGVITSAKGTLRFGELVTEAAAVKPADVTLKAPGAFTLIGKDRPRLEGRDKVTGAATFGIDVRVPGLKYAAVAMPPAFGSTPLRYDQAAAMAKPGVRAVVALPGSDCGDPPAVAVVADGWWQARQGVAALNVQWSLSPAGALSTPGLMETLRSQALTDDGLPMRSSGDAMGALAAADRVVDVVYDAPYLAHAPMEPMNATVRVTADAVECWVGTQVPTFAVKALARIAGVSEEQVTLHQQLLGGAFGRRLEVDVIAQCTAIAKAVPGTPVQLLYAREDDTRHAPYRPATVARLRAGINAAGAITGVVAHSAGQAPFRELSRRVRLIWTENGPDRTTSEGTWDQPYEFPALRASHADCAFPVPVGSWRAVGHSHQAFFFESFIDELAAATMQDPLAFRLSLLTRHPRATAVLKAVAERAGWGTPLAAGEDGRPRARGLALHMAFGTTVAQIAEVSLGENERIRVHRVTCAVDCGLAVNPNGIRQQMESGIIFGLSAALGGAITIDQGRVREGNFDTLQPLRIADTPIIDTIIMPSSAPPTGVGEPGLPPIAPAVANALFVLTGTRLRSLPLRVPSGQLVGRAP